MNVKALLAEFLGTFALIFVGVGVIATDKFGGGSGLLGIALAHGLVIACLASALGATSGGHFNPAVSLGLFLGRKIDVMTMVSYWMAQLAGAAVGALLANMAFEHGSIMAVNHGIPVTVGAISQTQAIILEGLATFFLVMTVFGTAVDNRGPRLGALLIGLSIVVGILFCGPLTGAALNPARWFGPAVINNSVGQAVIYLVGPLAGGALAGILYPMLFGEKDEAVAVASA